jgi:subtilisin family serine protease
VAKGANLMSVQVFSSGFFGMGSVESDVIAGLERVYLLRNSYNFASVNMSFGRGRFSSRCDSNPMKPAIDNLRSVGIASIAASGNNGYTNALATPACISTAVSVGCTEDGSGGTTADRVCSFSNSASFLSLLAPGSRITSSVPGSDFAILRGTSMSAPHVAGAWAVLKQGDPAANVTDILTTLQETGVPITDRRNGITTPRISFSPAGTTVTGTCDGLTAAIVGKPGDDVIKGTPGADVIDGLGGNDTIRGAGGTDTICGGTGDDLVYGGSAGDRLFGQGGKDRLRGNAGDDRCDGGSSRDTATTCEMRFSIP